MEKEIEKLLDSLERNAEGTAKDKVDEYLKEGRVKELFENIEGAQKSFIEHMEKVKDYFPSKFGNVSFDEAMANTLIATNLNFVTLIMNYGGFEELKDYELAKKELKKLIQKTLDIYKLY